MITDKNYGESHSRKFRHIIFPIDEHKLLVIEYSTAHRKMVIETMAEEVQLVAYIFELETMKYQKEYTELMSVRYSKNEEKRVEGRK